jgi:hypothetical protein
MEQQSIMGRKDVGHIERLDELHDRNCWAHPWSERQRSVVVVVNMNGGGIHVQKIGHRDLAKALYFKLVLNRTAARTGNSISSAVSKNLRKQS